MTYLVGKLLKVLYYYKLTLRYRGAAFCGFARQPENLTVQGNLEQALRIVLHEDILTVCAGRTDAGVHARAQVVSFACSTKISNTYKFLRSINALIHEDICVNSCEEVDKAFSARFDAVERIYKYYIYNSCIRPMFTTDFSWHVSKPLNVEAMRQASRHLIGEHDFKSFCTAKSSIGKTTMRCVNDILFDKVKVADEELIEITVSGNAFLHSMVRTIVGSLVMVGKSQREPEWMKTVLDAKSRDSAGECAPAKGLVFWQVKYA